MDDYLKRIMDEFKEKRPLYEEFCFVIYKLLNSLLENNHYKYQILYRIKEFGNLEEKLIRKRAEGKMYKNLNEIGDLAGLRIIFYLEKDKNKFIEDIQREISGELKFEEVKKKTGYEAIHVIIGLGEKRLQLSEYKKFEALKCEIQLTSILHHAWSEIEHDLIYKDENKIKEVNPERYGTISRRLKNVFKRYIKKASSELERISKQIKKN